MGMQPLRGDIVIKLNKKWEETLYFSAFGFAYKSTTFPQETLCSLTKHVCFLTKL